ncbi:MAG: nucleotidyl transferase AbiEii/AbiGii toxin family protein [Anaerolineae bacterium]|nr:nucleotidyl transferase AbiEii/AbiGii toxin family protein [Anaerolineae bacterium]
MNELHWEAITGGMRRVLRTIGDSALSARFYLAGGTALALQLGHRRSVDLDLFSEQDEVRTETHLQVLRTLRTFRPTLVEQEWGNLVLILEQIGLRVGFFGYGYRLAEQPARAEGVALASLTDIGLMKLDAIASRASRKDFIDLYAIAAHVPLRVLLDRAPDKYPGVRDFEAMVVRHLAYFERAEREAQPEMLHAITWETVKAFCREQALALGREWLR